MTKTDDGQGNVVLTNKHERTKPVTPEPKKPGKKIGFLPSTGTTISLISLVLAFVVASSAAYLLKKKKK
ncbi:LPXTG cell wall anchor domain-containing protein [Streptococcus sp. KHUD_013]|uniref:LPXTG cell wall anchor domain-containing protein n=1 Tax=Streptococcus sp. KHUD_013 TaxID=3413147 RepID=UPI004040380B